jgi:hypothetical protein
MTKLPRQLSNVKAVIYCLSNLPLFGPHSVLPRILRIASAMCYLLSLCARLFVGLRLQPPLSTFQEIICFLFYPRIFQHVLLATAFKVAFP